MSERRAARAKQTRPRRPTRDAQVEFLRRPVSDPAWHDADVLREVFGELFSQACESRLAMGGRVHNRVLGIWALANGFVDDRWGHPLPNYTALRRFLEDSYA